MDFFSLFRRPANPFEAAVSRREYKAYSHHYRLLPEEHKQAILQFVGAGMNAKQAFHALWAILLSPELNEGNFNTLVQEVVNKHRP